MSGPIRGVPATPAAPAAVEAGKPNGGHDLAEVGREFEAIFVRTLLRSTPLGQGQDAYTDMGVDAMARSVTQGRGLGLADLIRRALDTSEKAGPAEKRDPGLKNR